jgi:hypothetical protein
MKTALSVIRATGIPVIVPVIGIETVPIVSITIAEAVNAIKIGLVRMGSVTQSAPHRRSSRRLSPNPNRNRNLPSSPLWRRSPHLRGPMRHRVGGSGSLHPITSSRNFCGGRFVGLVARRRLARIQPLPTELRLMTAMPRSQPDVFC